MTLIPYDEIDCEIRGLVRAMNRFPGIVTVASCADHLPDPPVAARVWLETEVCFTASTDRDLGRLLNCLPFCGWRGGVANSEIQWRQIWTTVMPSEHFIDPLKAILDGRPLYKLRIAGYPYHWQRLSVQEVQDELTKAFESTLRSPCYLGGPVNMTR